MKKINFAIASVLDNLFFFLLSSKSHMKNVLFASKNSTTKWFFLKSFLKVLNAFLIPIFGNSSGLAPHWQSYIPSSAELADIQPAEGMGREGHVCLQKSTQTSPEIPLRFSA